MVSLRIDLSEAKKIEREAQKILKAKAQGVSARKVKGTAESRAYAKKLRKFKELTGKKRLTYDQKKALHVFTARQVARHVNAGSKTYTRRLKAFEKIYGPADEQTRYVLEYLAPKAAAKKLEIEPPEIPDDDLEEATFSDVSLPGKTWDDLPENFTRRWSHRSGSYMYENADILWLDSSASLIDMQRLFDHGEDGDDFTNHDFFEQFTPELWRGVYLYDPNGTEEKQTHIMVLASEWAEVGKLPDDWVTTRKYFRKKR